MCKCKKPISSLPSFLILLYDFQKYLKQCLLNNRDYALPHAFLMDLRSSCKTERPKRNIFVLLIHVLFVKKPTPKFILRRCS